MSARNLKDTDIIGGTADPYVELQLLPAPKEKHCALLERARTRFYKDAGKTVEINESFKFPMFLSSLKDYNVGKRDRAGNLKLKLELKDKDWVKDDSLGLLSVNLNPYLINGAKGLTAAPPVTAHLKKTLAGKETSTVLKYSIDFVKADVDVAAKQILERTGTFQILAMDAKDLPEAETFGFWGKIDPRFEICFMSDSELTSALAADQHKRPFRKQKWSRSSAKDGAGATPFWHEWLEVTWDEKLINAAEEKSAIITVWDDNCSPAASTLIGANKLSINELIATSGSSFIDLYSGGKGKGISEALHSLKNENKVRVGRVRIAAQFKPDAIKPPLIQAAGVEKGGFRFYVGSVTSTVFDSKNTKKKQTYKVVVQQDEKNSSGFETQCVSLAEGRLEYNEKLSEPLPYKGTADDFALAKIKVSLVSEQSGKTVAALSLPSETFYTAYKASCLCKNTVARRYLSLIPSEEDKKVKVSGCRVELIWAFVQASEDTEIGDDELSKYLALGKGADLQPSCRPGKLKVRVHNAENLHGHQWHGTSDPFPAATLFPENESKKFFPPAKDMMPNPKWDWKSKAEWEFLVDDATTASLDINVCNYNESKGTYGNDVMGTASVNVGRLLLDEKLEEFLPHDQPNVPKRRLYTLNSKGSTVEAEVWFESDGDGVPTAGFFPATSAGSLNGRAITQLPELCSTEKIDSFTGTFFFKPISVLNLRNMDSDGKNDIKLRCEIFDDGGNKSVVCDETEASDSAGESHEFDKLDMLKLKFEPEYFYNAQKCASTPIARLQLVDVDRKKKDTVIGEISFPLLSLLLNDSSVYKRDFILTNELGSGDRGKLEILLQYVSDVNDVESYTIPEDMMEKAKEPIPGTVMFDIKSGRELQRVTRKTKKPSMKILPSEADPRVTIELSRRGYSVDHIHGDQPDTAFHGTQEHTDGGASPQWEEIGGDLISHDIELDMVTVSGYWNGDKKFDELIGSFTVPLIELAQIPTKAVGGWFPLVHRKSGGMRTGSLRLELNYRQDEVVDKDAGNILVTQTGPKGYSSGKGQLEVVIIAARGMTMKDSEQRDFYVEGGIFPPECLQHAGAAKWETKVDEDVEKGDVCIFNDKRKIGLEWQRVDEYPPVVKLTLKRKSFMRGKIGTVCIDVAPYIMAPGQPAEFWVALPGTSAEVKVAMRFDDAVRKTDTVSHSADSAYVKCALKKIRNFNTIGNVHCMVLKTRKLKDVSGHFDYANDPYVKVRVYGSALKQAGIETETRTKTDGGSVAKFNETMMFQVDNRQMAPGSCTNLLMDIQVFDKNKVVGDTRIGCATIPILPFQTLGGHTFEDWFPLRDKKGENGKFAGEIHLATQWLPEGVSAGARVHLSGDRPLYVHLQRAEGLKSVTRMDKMDPFVRIEVKDQDVQVDSDVQWDEGTTPTWDSILPVELSDKEGETPKIMFTVLDKDEDGSEIFIGSYELDLFPEVLKPSKDVPQKDPLKATLPVYKTVPYTLDLVDKLGKSAGKLYIRLRRDEFEGMEGRDDGVNRGKGNTSVEEDFGEDDDDDGEADGRLHVQVLHLSGFTGQEFQCRESKLRLCINPANKYKKTKDSFKLVPQGNNEKKGSATVFGYSPEKDAPRGGLGNFDFVMPYMCNKGNAGDAEEDTSLTVQLVAPGSFFKKEKILVSGTVLASTLDELEVARGAMSKPSKEVELSLGTVENNVLVKKGSVSLKLTYIPFVSGKVRISVVGASELPESKSKDPRIQVYPVVNGRKEKPAALRDGKSSNDDPRNPKWDQAQIFINYNNGRQKCPDDLVVRLKNLGKDDTIGQITIPFLDLVRKESGGKLTIKHGLLTDGKDKPTGGHIELEAMFTHDGRGMIVDASPGEEIKREEDIRDIQDGGSGRGDDNGKTEDALKLLKLKNIFYKIDVDSSNEIDKNELKKSLDSHSKDTEDVREFLESAWKRYVKNENEKRKEQFDKEGRDNKMSSADQVYNIENVFTMIQGPNGDDKVSFDEWNAFVIRNVCQDRCKILKNVLRLSRPGVGDLADKKKKMMKVKGMILGYTQVISQVEKNRLAAEEKRRRERARRLAEEKKIKEQEEEEIRRRKELDDIRRAEENAQKLEFEKLQIKLAEVSAQREHDALERERLKQDKAEQDRLREERRRKKAEKKKIKYTDLPESQVLRWKPYHVAKWVGEKLDLKQYCELFQSNSVDGLLLLSLSEQEIKDDLQIPHKLHRAKVMCHIMRLRQLAGLPEEDRSHKVVGSTRKTRPRSVIQIGKSGGAANAAAPELMRMKLKKFTNKVNAKVKKEDADDATKDAVWPFQYDNPANKELVTSVNMFDFDDDWGDQFQGSDPFGHEAEDDDDEPPEEAAFRRAMQKVWAEDAKLAKSLGYTVSAADAFGEEAAGGGQSAKNDPYAFVMKFAKENQMSFYEAVMQPEIKKLNLRLKTGDSIYAQTEGAIECRQLPPEYWFKNELPWWMTIDNSGGNKVGDSTVVVAKRRRRTKIPGRATTEEVLAIVRESVLEYGRHLEEKRKKESDPERFQEELKMRREKIRRMREKQGMPQMQPVAEEEDRLLADVFRAMSNLQNNETVMKGKSGSWTGWHDKLNRLKLQGAIKVLLRLDMSWQQFDSFFRTLSTNNDGTLQLDEFVAAFRADGKMSDLLRMDRAGEQSRRGGRVRRHNRNLNSANGYHGMGAKAGDADWKQILDALHGVLRTLEESNINLREAFESFDRNASGEISVAEFASLFKTLGGVGLSKRQIYHIIGSMDANFDRTVRYNEFMEFFLVVWVGRLKDLKRNFQKIKKGSAASDGTLEYGSELKISQVKRRLMKAEHALKATFGSGFMAAAANAGAVLPGAFSALMNKMGLETSAIKASFMPTDKSGEVLVQKARTMTLSPDGRKFKQAFDAAQFDATAPTVIPGAGRRRTKKRVKIQAKPIAGKGELKRLKLQKQAKVARGELAGATIRDFGSDGMRELNVPKRTNMLDSFPKSYEPRQ